MPVSGSNGYRSGIVTLPNRVRLREMDSRAGMYPTMARTGDKDRMGNNSVTPYNDQETIVFSNNLQNVMYGSLTISGSHRSTQPYAGNNDPNGGLSGPGRFIEGISDNSVMTDYKSLASANSNNSNLSFFDDSRINLTDDLFYMTGTDPSAISGFESRLHDKTQIQIDLSTSTPTTFGYTEKSTNFDPTKASSAAATSDLTNIRQQLMVYWNNALNRWEKISFGYGPNTLATGSAAGANLGYEFYNKLGELMDTSAVGFSPIGGNIVASGSSYPYPTYSEDVIKTIGKPTSIMGFPTHGKFHATGSQTIKMSDYINKPFLLEKLHLKFDAKFEFASAGEPGSKAFSLNRVSAGGGTSDFFNGRDFYMMPTFFMLRQQKVVSQTTFKRDIPLIFSEGVEGGSSDFSILDNTKNSYRKFYNSVMLGHFSPPHVQTSGLFNLDFTLPGNFKLTSGSDQTTHVNTDRDLVTYGQIALFASASTRALNGDIYQKLPGDKKIALIDANHKTVDGNTFESLLSDTIPALTGTFEFGFKSRVVPVLPPRFGEYAVFTTGSSTGTKAFLNIFHNWEGGRTLSRNVSYPSENTEKLILPTNMRSKGRGLLRDIPAFNPGTMSLQKVSNNDNALPIPMQYPEAATVDLDSPYLLFPEDEIIFGWQYPYVIDNNAQQPNTNSSTTNTMTLDGVSKLTMFGSQVKNNKEFHDTLNQPLTSETVHEAIHYDNPVIDQYLIASRGEYSGSYLDNFTTGSAGSGIRSLIGSPENVLSGSFQRFLKCNNIKDRYYDTLLPDIQEMFRADGFKMINGDLFGIDEQIKVGSITTAQSPNEYIHDFWHTIFPFEGRYKSAERRISQNIYIYQIGSVNSATDQVENRAQFTFLGEDSQTNIKGLTNSALFAAFTFGNAARDMHIHQAGTTRLDRPAGFKYGIKNARKETTCAIYRPDRYTGQYADIMQQQYDTRFFDEKTNTLSDPPVKIKFVLPDDEREIYLVLDENETSVNTFESSNISIYATSSLPYYDDGTSPKNRSYNNLPNRVIEIEV